MSVGLEDSAGVGTVELDSHADTFVGGNNCVMLPGSATSNHATVHLFSEESHPFKNILIGSVAMAWVDPKTSETIILVFNKALFFGDHLKHSLLCPNQLHAYGIEVQDAPMLWNTASSHVIHSEVDNLMIPFHLSGVISVFDTHKPSEKELADC